MGKRLNIVYVADIPQTGGASECLFDLAATMASDYGAVCTVLFPTDGPLRERLESAGVRTVVTGHRGFLVARPQAAWKTVPKYLIELALYLTNRDAAIKKAEAAIDFSTVDIIHSNLPRNDLGIMLSEKYSIPHVCHLREFSFDDFRCWSYRPKPARYLSKRSDILIAVSQACGDAWVKRGVAKEKLRVIYDGIDLDKFRKNERGASCITPRPSLRMVFLGGCSEAKGVMDAVQGVAMLPDGLRERATLDIFGWSSPGSEREVRRSISELRLGDRVRVCGVCDDVPPLLSGYDVGLVCSRCEAFGRVVIEYQAAGLAVIGPDTGSLPELLAGGERGVLYSKAEGAEALAVALAQLITDEEKRLRLRKNGLMSARNFGKAAVVESCLAAYEELID